MKNRKTKTELPGNKPLSYRDSHKAAEKGRAYQECYQSERWRRFLWDRERLLLSRFLDEFLSGQEIHLLDFACGTGRVVGYLETRVASSVGVDVSRSMLDVARGELKHTELIEADLTQENLLLGRRFNLITAFRFFLNAEPELRLAALRAIVPLLADDGYLVINNHRNLTSPMVFATMLYNRLRRCQGNFMFLSHMRNLVEDAGLEIVRVYPVGVLSIPRLTVPDSWNHRLDDVVLRYRFLSFLCESPIVVCRRRSAGDRGRM
ncbi:MAG: class I SAM-dependent methyltransferase [Candidatus Krumholzibacteria bacterium]|nr:class I SAM-dependent methyltransferase [Candidatus Krumholzibacteria bacterium]